LVSITIIFVVNNTHIVYKFYSSSIKEVKKKVTNKLNKLTNRPKTTKKYTLPLILISLFIILTISMGTVSAADWTVGPGGSYNYNSIQDAINNESTLSGDTITVDPNGTDPYTENVVVNKNNLTIQANGAVTVSGSGNPSSPVMTINSGGSLAKIFGFNLTGVTGSAGVLINGANNVNLANLTINNCQVGVRTQSSNNLIVENVTIDQVSNGVLIDNAGYAGSDNITLKNLEINSPSSHAIYIGQYPTLTTNLHFENITINNCANIAITKHGEASIENFYMNQITINNPIGNGIHLTDGPYGYHITNIQMNQMNINGAKSDAIYISMTRQESSHDVTLTNSTINGTTGNGATIQARGTIIIQNNNNTFTNNTGWGLYLTGIGTTTTTFQNNQITNNGNGLYLNNIHNINITNTLQDNGGTGCHIVSCKNIIIQDINFTNTTRPYNHAILIDNAGYAGSDNITLKNLEINSPSSHAIYIGAYGSQTNNLLIENVTITNSGANAIHVNEEAAIQNTTINRTTINNPNGHGIYINPIYWHPAINTTINGTTINNAHNDAIYINMARTDSQNITINNTTINGTTGNGATIHAKGTINITNNNQTIQNNTGWGLYLTGYGTTTTTFQNNHITNNGNGIRLENIYGLTINNTNNNIHDNGGINYQLINCDNTTLENLQFNNNIRTYTHAIHATSCDNLILKNLYINNSNNAAILIDNGGYATSIGVTLQHIEINSPLAQGIIIGAYGSQTNNLLIENVTITNSGANAIHVNEEAAIQNTTINRTTINNPNGHGIYINPIYWHPAINTTINGTTINNAHNDAIYINMARTDSQNITINNTTINGTTGNGATIHAKGTINITNNNQTIQNNTGWGLYLTGYNNPSFVFNNNSIRNNGYGLWLQGISGGNFQDNQLVNNTDYDLYATGDTSNSFTGLLVGLAHPTLMNFDYINGIIIKGVENAPADPAGWVNIGKYVDIQGMGSSTVNLTVHYNTTDVAGKNEAGLKMLHYGSNWSELPQPNGVNTAEKFVYAKGISSFSTFAPLAEKFSTTLELPDVTGYRNEEKEIYATLKGPNGVGLAYKEVKFFVNGIEVGHADTDGSGIAKISWILSDSAGTYTLSAVFEGDESFNSSTNTTATLTINKRPTTLIVNNTSGLNGQEVLLAARLTSEGIAVSSVTITFTIEGNSYTATTDSNGWATKTYPIIQNPGTYIIEGGFTENGYFLGSANNGTLTVEKNATRINVENITGQKGQTVVLTAKIVDNNGQALANKLLNFQVNGVNAGTDETDNNGVAIVNYLVNLVGGNYIIQTDFAGDKDHLASNGNGNLKVPQSSLYIRTTASKTNPTLGETITITFKLGNDGPDIAENVIFPLVIPEGMEFITASTDQGSWTYNDTTRTITWNLGNVTVGDPNLWAIVRVLNNGNYVLTPLLSTETYDPNLNSNIQPITISVQAAALESETLVNAGTVGMQNTGAPIALLVIAVLMALGGILAPKRKK
jgi:hypothetical protein